jgi:hypothetical protein
MIQAGMPTMQEPVTQTEGQAPVHPEEIRASVDLHIGSSVSLKATVRTTPAGLVTAGVMVAAIVLSIAGLVWAARRRDPPKELSTEATASPTQNLQASPAAPREAEHAVSAQR